ncbi:rhomboid family intramembrane serine protease [Halalkalibacter urbisdiaboli]|uniref:rhomboid family intramembrane serine protease n=1 Tax=Halalkalibacter urbisdiaboli TaxID=1960589 RepID=UPI000B437005|nr:rhomboid family intramembrane serine protease [Halalkalibacter urbisdiaboli]
MFIRNESFYSFRKNYPVITVLVAIHFILFLWMNLLPGGRFIAEIGIGYNLAVAYYGEYWRLVTPIFMHLGLGHVLFNSFSLVIFGPGLEKMLGKVKFLTLYLFAGIIANIATFYLGGLSYPQHLGASGAIFGLFGAYVYIVLNRKNLIDRANSQLVMTILIIGLVMTFVNSNINILAHLFGLIGGAALAPILLTGVRSFSMYQHVHEPQSVSFNPNRWARHRKNKKLLVKSAWILFIIFVLFGLGSRLF